MYWLVLIPILTILVLYIISLFDSDDNDNDNSNQEVNYPEWVNYTQDVFDGIQYRWKYHFFNNNYEIKNISPYCNNCSCMLVNKNCPNCKKTYVSDLWDSHTVKSITEVEALITHRIENNFYRGVLD